MGQGLLGVVQNIGASLGVTVTSVLFERNRVLHQLYAYDTYDAGSAEHANLLSDLKHVLHQSGMIGGGADEAALSTIKHQIDVEAIAAAFRDSFFLLGGFFLLASIPMVFILSWRFGPAARE
jgi:hypothetical protein